MAIVLTQAQLDQLISLYASGVSEVDVPGGQRIKYFDPGSLAKLLLTATTEEPQEGAFRTFATFYRNR